LLSLLGALARIDRMLQQLSRLACQFAISFCALLGRCCLIAIFLARGSQERNTREVWRCGR
jgi:hypothetical protein